MLIYLLLGSWLIIWIRFNRHCEDYQKDPPAILKQWLHKSKNITETQYNTAWNWLIIQINNENKKFFEELEESIRAKIIKEPTLKWKCMVQEIEKLYNLQFNEQKAKDEEVKIKETEEQPNIECKTQNGKISLFS